MSSSLAAHVEFPSSLSSALSACDREEVGFISARVIRDICHDAQLPSLLPDTCNPAPHCSLPLSLPLPRTLVRSLSQGLLNEHEVLTLARHYGEKKFPCLFPLIRLIQDNLRKQNFTAFEELRYII